MSLSAWFRVPGSAVPKFGRGQFESALHPQVQHELLDGVLGDHGDPTVARMELPSTRALTTATRC